MNAVPPASADRWAAYSAALSVLHHQVAAVARADTAQAEQFRRERADVQGLGGRLTEQGARLARLSALLRYPLATDAFVPAPVASGPWPQAVRAVSEQLDQADKAAAEALSLSRRPQLLPGWGSAAARHAVVYLAFVLPNALFTTVLSLLEVTSVPGLMVWYLVVFPMITLIGGGLLVGRLGAPRLGTEPPGGGSPLPAEPPARRHWFLGLLMAWASWAVPGFGLEIPLSLLRG